MNFYKEINSIMSVAKKYNIQPSFVAAKRSEFLYNISETITINDIPDKFRTTYTMVVNEKTTKCTEHFIKYIAKKTVDKYKIYLLDLRDEIAKINFSTISTSGNFSDKVEKAKCVPIASFIGEPKSSLSGTDLYSSPLKDVAEKTPGFHVYPAYKTGKDYDTFYDFTLGVGGDAVALYEMLNNCDFKTAVTEMYNKFY